MVDLRADGASLARRRPAVNGDRKSTRLNSSHLVISYAVFCLKKKKRYAYVLRNETNGATITAFSQPPCKCYTQSLTTACEAHLRYLLASLLHPRVSESQRCS